MPYIPGHKFTTSDAGLNDLLTLTYHSAGKTTVFDALDWGQALDAVQERLADSDTYRRLRPYLCKTCSGLGMVGGPRDYGDGNAGYESHPCPSCATPEALLDAMTPEQRLHWLGMYCRACGDKNPTCQCWNDD